MFARVGVVAQTGDEKVTAKAESELVDIRADLVYPYKVNDSVSVLCLVGNFSAQHNGAVITADSAVRYEDERLECYGNVLINKNTTYAYADRADYDSANNTAALYSPLIKVVDQDIILYSYNFSFNTLDNVGQYWGGGVTIKRDSTGREDLMESRRGYYYADNKHVVGVEAVELSGEGYLMKGDSVIYEMANEMAYFFDNTNIWNEDGNYLYGDKGLYNKVENLYEIRKNGYLLNEEQEMWSDSIEYYRERELAIMRSNIQIDDTTHKSLAFGDFAQCWGDVEEMLLTRRPSIINYDESQGDSLFLRGDTIRVISYAVGTGPAAEQESSVDEERERLMAELRGGEKVIEEPIEEEPESELEAESEPELEPEIVEIEEEKIITPEVVDTLPTKQELKERARAAKVQSRKDAYELKEYRKLVARREKLESRISEKRLKGRSIYADSIVLDRIMGQLLENDVMQDSLMLDSLSNVADTLVGVAPLPKERDSLYRVAKVYRNVRSYKGSSQMVCDSLVAISYDTMMRLYISPVMWSDNNQISSEEMYIYTKDGDLDYADFMGKPVMSSQIFPNDTIYFNQVSGKEMTAFFENNNIYRNDVDGNVQTAYYIQDDNTKEVTTLANIESGSASFFIKERKLDGVIYRSGPRYIFAPLDKISVDMKRYLPDFGWYARRRPTRKSTFDRVIRPTEREERSALERPTFPIYHKINASREKLVRGGEWRDRDDLVSEDATAWMKSLGFTPGEPREEDDIKF